MLVEGDEGNPMTTKKYRDGTSWTTEDELDHIADLGSHHTESHRVPRMVWLQRYIEVMPLKASWGNVETGVARAYAEKELRLEQQRVSRGAIDTGPPGRTPNVQR